MKKERRKRKNHFIVFYDENDEELIGVFNSIKEICLHKRKELTKDNLNLISVELCRALKRENHLTRMLNGKNMRVYIIDEEEDKEDL